MKGKSLNKKRKITKAIPLLKPLRVPVLAKRLWTRGKKVSCCRLFRRVRLSLRRLKLKTRRIKKKLTGWYRRQCRWRAKQVLFIRKRLGRAVRRWVNYCRSYYRKAIKWPFLVAKRARRWLSRKKRRLIHRGHLILYCLVKQIDRLDAIKKGEPRFSFFMFLAWRSIRARLGRSLVTIGGIAIGIGTIVFLVGLGFGLQQLVVGEVVKLNALRIADVLPKKSIIIALDEETVNNFRRYPETEKVEPLVSLVGRASVGDSLLEAVVLAADLGYWQMAAISPKEGKFWQQGEERTITLSKPENKQKKREGKVAGTRTGVVVKGLSVGKKIGRDSVDFNFTPDKWVPVYTGFSLKSELLGYTKRTIGGFVGGEYLGGPYSDESGRGYFAQGEEGEWFGKWLEAAFPLWQIKSGSQCDARKIEECSPGDFEMVEDEDGNQKWLTGLVTEKNVIFSLGLETQIEELLKGEILGEATSGAETALFSSELDEAIPSTKSGTEGTATGSATIVRLFSRGKHQVVVNSAFTKAANPKETNWLGKKIKLSFVLTKTLLPQLEKRTVSEPEEYEIVGVFEDDSSPQVLVPLDNITSLGVRRYSQVKVLAKSEDLLFPLRKKIEDAGFATSSVADTVKRISEIFGVFRVILSVFGLIALAVAALGMFNTLTVSLLERTREIGILKALGMKDRQVRTLFLFESLFMGVFGGFLGVLLGVLIGRGVNKLFSLMADKAAIVFISPPRFLLAALLFSFLVAFITGWYPARRATKISALNALRYE